MKLTQKNYFSSKSSKEYLSVSQYKTFVGYPMGKGCEARGIAEMHGEGGKEEEYNEALLIGRYVDAYFEGTLCDFKEDHPEILKKDFSLKVPFQHADVIIERIEKDEYFMKYMAGQKQVILTGELFGAKWKCKIDSFDPTKYITDLKVMASLQKRFYSPGYGKMTFVQAWGYDIQAAVYQAIAEQNIGKKLPFFIAGASKEKSPDIEIIGFTQLDLDEALFFVGGNVERILKVKNGEEEPYRCEECDYCRDTKKLKEPIHFSKLLED